MSARGGKRRGRRADKRMAQGWHATSAEQRGWIKEIETRERRAGLAEIQDSVEKDEIC